MKKHQHPQVDWQAKLGKPTGPPKNSSFIPTTLSTRNASRIGPDTSQWDHSISTERRTRRRTENSQTCKLQHIIKKAGIRDGNRVLEIGSGWGSMAMTIVQQYPNVMVDTLICSVQQQSLAQDRI
ncbi:uncharacterized protein LACBIDRAFT_299198 [Laccaria bicolor S238N-H82]|uniref:Predicted protein n=1 Tax=Laccaria bicolor (strain S238N-H82 / ATCC MYA-4686) TaxID=486041 RepID=B0E3N3_LACBS|nr:uncharacterized protein LACBIDRAFT_299198 [Laccaria bicolor S238N-H82]EDQ98548.1 predicted protein [Laccaria bicolor S238N-H82]|eukprot:XP_001890803.1 predicted protein [Laccaria bicolor S238N-H82]